jgi:hypothetical protein
LETIELPVTPNFDWLSQGSPQISANLKYLNNLSNKDGEKLALVFELMDMNLYELISGAKTYLPS